MSGKQSIVGEQLQDSPFTAGFLDLNSESRLAYGEPRTHYDAEEVAGLLLHRRVRPTLQGDRWGIPIDEIERQTSEPVIDTTHHYLSVPVTRLIHQATLQRDIRERLLRKIEEIKRQASGPNWDGEGAVPLEADTVAVARKLVSYFPSLEVEPDVLASPRGEIDFDWDIDRRISLIVCVCGPPDHDIVFLATNGGAEVRGREPWTDELPQLVRCCFERMKGYL